MMPLLLGELPHALEEVQPGDEVLDAPLAADALAVCRQFPVGQRLEVLAHRVGGQLRHAPFTGDAMFAGEFGRCGTHGSLLFRRGRKSCTRFMSSVVTSSSTRRSMRRP